MASRPRSSASSQSSRSIFSRHKNSTSSLAFSITSLNTNSTVTFDDFVSPTKMANGLGLTFSDKPATKEAVSATRRPTVETRQPTRVLNRPPKLRASSSNSNLTKPKTNTSGSGFKDLPEEILLGVLAELKTSHLQIGASCSTCWMRDLISLGLSCKEWWIVARRLLYEDIQLVGLDSIAHKKKIKIKYGTRLVLLRRTLRHRSTLAAFVKSLKVPSMPAEAKTKKEQDEYLDLVSSLIMACPNLERLPGFYPSYKHEFSRFPHALSTRAKLQEKVWIIDPVDESFWKQSASKQIKGFPPPKSPKALTPGQRIDFLDYHADWSYMQTLVFYCNPGGTLDSQLFTDIFNSLPSLKNLHVSSFPSSSFSDQTLLTLPPLQSLRLDNLPGITSRGLSHYASLRSSTTLESLSLISLPLLSLPVLARLFSHLTSLTTFTLSQSASPYGIDVFLFPYLASRSLQTLHWELTTPHSNAATSILAKSIQHAGFPSLQRIRAPVDPDGSLQNLCRPVSKITVPGDEKIPIETERQYENHLSDISARNQLSALHSHSARAPKSPLDAAMHEEQRGEDGKGFSLSIARRLAQRRIENARTKKEGRYKIVVKDENGKTKERLEVGRFVGQMGSQIEYDLGERMEGSDEGVVRLDAVLGDEDGRCNARFENRGVKREKEKEKERGREEEREDICTGAWNSERGWKGGKGKEKCRWWHTERQPWRDFGLERLF